MRGLITDSASAGGLRLAGDLAEPQPGTDDENRGCGQEHKRPVDEAGRWVQPWGLTSADGGCEYLDDDRMVFRRITRDALKRIDATDAHVQRA
jgi:hypothetical protein